MRNLLPLLALVLLAGRGAAESPESRAIDYLAREVPRWPAEEKCFSCHNSGVAAGSLFAAVRLGHKIPDKALTETTRWLSQPDKWDAKRDGGAATDQALVRIQFGAALSEALDAAVVKERRPLRDAAKLIATDQRKDGSWQVSAEGTLGSPATLGPALATHLARGVLRKADAKGHADAVAKADHWLRQVEAKNVADAAGVLLALEGAEDRDAVAQRQRCLQFLRKCQDRNGGWGAYATSAPESFDTALALLALARYPKEEETAKMIERGRTYLIAAQEKEGNWPETTRPAGGVSYAQRTATTGWALQALLATGKASR
jgi:Squalene-hopene cyclase C-terminal domain